MCDGDKTVTNGNLPLMHPHVFLINKSGLICPKQSQGGNNKLFFIYLMPLNKFLDTITQGISAG